MKILLVLLQVRRQTFDFFGKLGHLILWRTSILVVPFDRRRDFLLLLVRKRHNLVSAIDSFARGVNQSTLVINVNKSTITRFLIFCNSRN